MSDAQPKPKAPGLRLYRLLPLGFFACLALIFLLRLESGVDPDIIPSALVGKPAPDFNLPPLDGEGVPGLSRAGLAGTVTVVNIFASWCVPCRDEHPMLKTLAAESGIRLVGIAYKDKPDDTLAFLGEVGNPYAAIGVDETGRTAIDWGVYGVPETFIVGADGIIRYKYIGPLTADSLKNVLDPQIAKARPPAG